MNILDILVKLGFGVTGDYGVQVEKVEEQLKLKFADDFRQYLVNYGQLIINGSEISGIFENSHAYVVKLTCEYMNLIDYDKDDLYVIEVLGFDGIVIWQNTMGEVFQTVGSSRPEKIQDSFVKYLENEII